MAHYFRVARCGSCYTHRHAEDLAEGVPEGEHVLFRNGLRGCLEVESEVVGTAGFDEPVGERSSAVVDAGSPVLAKLLYDASVLGNDVLAWYELDIGVARTSVAIGCDVAKLYERMSPEIGFERVFQQLLEPSLVEEVECLVVDVAFGIDELEGLSHDESYALADASGEMQVYFDVSIDVVEA